MGLPLTQGDTDMSDENMVNTADTDTGAVDAGNENTQVEEKVFTQSQLNDIVAKRVAQVTKKYSEVDTDELASLRTFKDSMEEEQLIKKQDFDGVLKKTKDKYGTEISALRTELERIKVDGSLIDAASKAKALAPQQVAKLLKDSVKLQSDGTINIVDDTGNPRYTDEGDPLTVDGLVDEFLSSNSYFRAAGPSGTGSTSNTGESKSTVVDLNSLDMLNPEHRALYKKLKQEGKL